MYAVTPLDHPRWLPRAAWPWPLATVGTPDGPIAITDAGSGPVLLLVHTGIWSFVWRDLMRELTPYFRCVTLDAPGNGLSYRPGRPGTTLAASAAATRAVVVALDLRDITLVLHDLGGAAGIAALADMPERVSGIVAVNTFAWRPPPKLKTMLGVMGSAPIRESNAALRWIPMVTRLLGMAPENSWNQSYRAAYRAGCDYRARRAAHYYFADARHADDLFDRVESALRNEFADHPLLTIYGERNDPFDFQGTWRQLFPNARQEVVAGGHHFPMVESPRAVADWIHGWHNAHALRQPGVES